MIENFYKSLFFRSLPALDPQNYNLNAQDQILTTGLTSFFNGSVSVAELKNILDQAYCGNVGAEFNYITCDKERNWLADRYEACCRESVDEESRKQIAELMLK